MYTGTSTGSDSGHGPIFYQLNSFMPLNYQEQVKAAFAAWSAVANINFVLIGDSGVAFGSPDAHGDIRLGGAPFDGPFNVLAHAHWFNPPFSNTGHGDIHFDTAEPWQIGFDGAGFDIFQIAAHEIGHAIGLGHTPVGNSLMNANYHESIRGLGPDDASGAIALYGPGGNGVYAFTNVWSSGVSGMWREGTMWSRGLPGFSGQSLIRITNASSKVVTIDSSTPSYLMAMKDLEISAPSGSQNMLLLNNAHSMNLSVFSHVRLEGSGKLSINNSDLVSYIGVLVGASGPANELLIASGGTVRTATAIIGSDALSSNNTAVVTGGGSLLHTDGSLTVGSAGSRNQMRAENGGQVSITDTGYIAESPLSRNNSALVTGGSTWNNGNHLYVGFRGSSNQLTISNGGRVNNTLGYIGYQATAHSNSVSVTTGGVWSNRNHLYVGWESTANQLSIASGGRVENVDGHVGFTAVSSNNSVLVTGVGSTWNNKANLYVGHGTSLGTGASGNQLIVANGGKTIVGGYAEVGYNANNSAVTITGNGSLWQIANELFIGEGGNGNQLTIANSGRVVNAVGNIGFSSSDNNSVLVTGPGSLWSNQVHLYVGRNGSGNQLTIGSSGRVVNDVGYVGQNAGANNNLALVTGGSIWSNRSSAVVGEGGSGNQLIISNAGKVFVDQNGFVGVSATANNNSALITGSSSLWSIRDNLYIGHGGDNAQLTVADSGRVANTLGYIGFDAASGNNSALVTGFGSVWSNKVHFYVGANGSGNQLTVSNGGFVVNDVGYVGQNTGANNNFALVTAGAIWSNQSSFVVGEGGSGNQLIISDAGKVFAGQNGFLGVSGTANNNSALVKDNTSLWSIRDNLFVGDAGDNNQLTVANSGSVVAANAFVGFDSASTGNAISLSGGNLVVTNAANTGVLDVRRGILTLNSGTLTVDRLLVTNGAASFFDFNGGTLITEATTLNIGSVFELGDGNGAQREATLRLQGGTHTFANNNLTIRSDGCLTGNGTVNGNVINSGGCVDPGFSPGLITINGDLIMDTNTVLHLQIGGYQQGPGYDFLDVSGAFTPGGRLEVSFVNGFENVITNGSSFTMLTADGNNLVLSDYVPNDNLGYFLVSYDSNNGEFANIEPGQFYAMPEPSSLMLLALGSVLLLCRQRND